MIFDRKYIFETKRTRAIRMALNSLMGVAAFFIGYFVFLLIILMTAKSEQTRVSEGLYQKSADAIVVLTGDKGRIKRALALTTKWPEARVIISGVYGTNTLKTIVTGQVGAEELLKSPVQVEIDYEALDTLGNVRETLEHLDVSNTEIKRVLVVTSDYHVMRVRMIFEHLMKNQTFEVYYEGVESNWSKWNNISKLLKESLKTLRVWVILKLS
jgi:uncharacterized SAM-binding protein YcdF (DUF218 family)